MNTILTAVLALLAKLAFWWVKSRRDQNDGQDAYQHERDRNALDDRLGDDPDAARRKLRDEWSRPD
jgi:hypothetical protein